jgi:alkylated DNA repair dioxygenase AlkB
METRKELGEGCWVTHDREWLTAAEADEALTALTEQVAWEERPIVAFGREIMQPRLIGWGGALPYAYSGQTLPERPLTPALDALLVRVSAACGVPFNHVLLNRYRDGRDHMSMHADNEPQLGREPVIAALSLGASRKFRLEFKRKRSRKRTFNLIHGSLFVMGGALQHRWRHAVPKMASVTGERINVTFRVLHGPPGWRAPTEDTPRPPYAERSDAGRSKSTQ